LTQGLSRLGAPNENDDITECSVMHGLSMAVEVLCECSEKQHELRTSMMEDASLIKNRGRIICITSVRSDSHIKMLEEYVQDSIVQNNKLAAGSDSLMPITHCEFYLVHTMPLGVESTVTEDKHNVSSVLTTYVNSTKSGRHLANKLLQLAQTHYELTMTTITGIPMK
ncbi:integrator complex subunit 13-like, partial [Saccoglossus kowalevskii]|uniref:Protein asunder homolog n=1 Tax=Saccoglossus kowalevskii TaxID=10224 RepID=A0ABM0MQZ3_SACKO